MTDRRLIEGVGGALLVWASAQRSPAASGSRARVCAAKWRRTDALCGALVFVDQPAEQVTSADTIEIDSLGR